MSRRVCEGLEVLGVAGKAIGGYEKKNDFFWTIVSVFEYQQIVCCEILGGCSNFRTRKRSYNSTRKFVNFMAVG